MYAPFLYFCIIIFFGIVLLVIDGKVVRPKERCNSIKEKIFLTRTKIIDDN